MSNVLSEEKRQQILALGRLGWSLRRIEEATGVRRETASGYLKAAGLTVRGRGRPRARPANPAIPLEVSTDSSPATMAGKGADETAPVPAQRPGRAPQASACEPYRELVVEALARGRNAMAIWQDLVDDHGFPAGYASVRRFVSTVRQQPAVEARAVIATAPGEEAQVDYGEGPMVRDPDTGKYRRTRLFVLTLGYSRKAVRLLVHRSSAQVWAELHERAFRRLGGIVRVVVLDNLKEGVLTPDIYDPTLNPLYRDVLAHYGVVALPCRVRDPDRKGKVEASVGHTQKTPLRGLRFEHLDDGQAYLDRWDRRWADTRIHGTTKRQVAAMFAEERPALGPLPLEPFRYYQYGRRTVHLDGCVDPVARRLLITADGGGSNGSRNRLWKWELQQFADEMGLRVSVCHFPPGTSKWNKIEHRMFCHITENWRGRPLVSREVVVNLIGHTTTQSGLAIRSELDENSYPTGQPVTAEQMESLSLKRDKFHGDWNYSLTPRETT